MTTRLSAGATPSQVQQELILRAKSNGEELTKRNIPTKQLCYNISASLKRSHLPTPDAIYNILLKHGKNGTNFLRQLHLHPILSIVLASPTALCLLEQYPEAILVDGTFDFCEGKLILTTWMGLVDRIGFPCVWILSDSRTAIGYAHSFSCVKSEAPALAPKNFLTDYEVPLQQGITMVYPSAVVNGDSFHFIWNNQTRLTSDLAKHPITKRSKTG